MDIFCKKIVNIINQKNDLDKSIYDEGINLIIHGNLMTHEKETIIYQLLFLFPDNYKLYYYMGYIYKDIHFLKALTWFKLCYEKNKEYVENILDFTKLLFENDLYGYIEYLNKDNFFKKFNDIRLSLLIINLEIKKGNFIEAEKLLLSIIENKNNDDFILYKAYANISFIYSCNNNFYKVFFYLRKAYDIMIKYNFNYELKKPIIDDIFLAIDYIYLNEEYTDLLQKAKIELNKILKNEYSYDLCFYKKDKIHIGYVSYDFENHAVSNFIIPIIENHNEKLFNVYIFNNNVNCKLLNNDKFHVINIYGLNTKDACDLVYENKIDILIDLNGHTTGHRLDIFSKNPSLIQINYLGFPNSVGLEGIKYRITDKIADNIDSIQVYNEKLLRLPKCFLLFHSILQNEPIEYKHVNEKNIIVGSFNKENKISICTIKCWKSILEKNKNIKILIKISGVDNILERENYYKKMLKIEKDRLILISKVSDLEYIHLFYQIDILLDTFPYSGTTTTCNALYNSIPVITKYHKDIHSHNVSASLLINSGLSELVAYSDEEYIEKVLYLCKNIEKINEYKKNIGKLFMKLMDKKEFMTDFENLLLELYNSEIKST